MGQINTCDGTGVEIPADTQETGNLGHQYCDAARPIAEKYLEDVDALHTKLANAFQTEYKALQAAYREKLKYLPDEP